MNMGLAAVAAVLAGIGVGGFIWYAGGAVSNVMHFLKQRAKNKPAAEDAAPEVKK